MLSLSCLAGFIGDHMPPLKYANGRPQRFYPHCWRCSQLQGTAGMICVHCQMRECEDAYQPVTSDLIAHTRVLVHVGTSPNQLTNAGVIAHVGSTSPPMAAPASHAARHGSCNASVATRIRLGAEPMTRPA